LQGVTNKDRKKKHTGENHTKQNRTGPRETAAAHGKKKAVVLKSPQKVAACGPRTGDEIAPRVGGKFNQYTRHRPPSKKNEGINLTSKPSQGKQPEKTDTQNKIKDRGVSEGKGVGQVRRGGGKERASYPTLTANTRAETNPDLRDEKKP